MFWLWANCRACPIFSDSSLCGCLVVGKYQRGSSSDMHSPSSHSPCMSIRLFRRQSACQPRVRCCCWRGRTLRGSRKAILHHHDFSLASDGRTYMVATQGQQAGAGRQAGQHGVPHSNPPPPLHPSYHLFLPSSHLFLLCLPRHHARRLCEWVRASLCPSTHHHTYVHTYYGYNLDLVDSQSWAAAVLP